MDKEQYLKEHGVNIPKTQLGRAKMNTLAFAAEKLFTLNGFYDTSISDICKEAHTAVGTFYIYFDTKTALYYYLLELYQKKIKKILTESIKNCQTRYEKEREGIKGFIKYAVKNPNVYNIIWGSLSIDKELFDNYYISFAKGYANALTKEKDVLSTEDINTLSYMLMGITNFVCLRAIFENMTDEDIDILVDKKVMPILSNGMFKK